MTRFYAVGINAKYAVLGAVHVSLSSLPQLAKSAPEAVGLALEEARKK